MAKRRVNAAALCGALFFGAAGAGFLSATAASAARKPETVRLAMAQTPPETRARKDDNSQARKPKRSTRDGRPAKRDKPVNAPRQPRGSF